MNQLEPPVLFSILQSINPHSLQIEMSSRTFEKLGDIQGEGKSRISFVPVQVNDKLEDAIVRFSITAFPTPVPSNFSIQLV